MEFDNKKNKHEKWHKILLKNGRKSSIFITIFALAFSGVGYLFVNQPNVQYFDKKVNFNQQVLQTFYKGNNWSYLIDIGKETEAEKHGIFLHQNQIKKYLNNMKEFQKNGQFDKEMFENFLKNNKITQYDVWQHAERQEKIEILENMILIPSQYKLVNELIKNEKILESVSGIQYTVKDELIEERLNQHMAILDESDFKDFIKRESENMGFSFINPEKRKGFLIEISNKQASDFSKEQLESIIKTQLTRNNAKEKIKQILGVDVNIINIEMTARTTGIEDLLFEKLELHERGSYVLIPIVEEIAPVEAKNLTNEELEVVKKEYRHYLFKKCAHVYSLEISNKYNKGILTEVDLKKICSSKPFTMSLYSTKTSQLQFFTVDINKSLVSPTYEGKIGIFICKNRKFENKASEFASLQKMGIDVNKFLDKSMIDSFLMYWIYKFENR